MSITTVTSFEQSILVADTPNMYTRPVESEDGRGGSLYSHLQTPMQRPRFARYLARTPIGNGTEQFICYLAPPRRNSHYFVTRLDG